MEQGICKSLMMKKVTQLITGMPASEGAGVRLNRILGQTALKHFDPFLLLDSSSQAILVNASGAFLHAHAEALRRLPIC